jgi:hypothetical protein
LFVGKNRGISPIKRYSDFLGHPPTIAHDFDAHKSIPPADSILCAADPLLQFVIQPDVLDGDSGTIGQRRKRLHLLRNSAGYAYVSFSDPQYLPQLGDHPKLSQSAAA